MQNVASLENSTGNVNTEAGMSLIKVHVPPLTKFCPETLYGVKRSHAKNFQNWNCGFPTIKLV